MMKLINNLWQIMRNSKENNIKLLLTKKTVFIVDYSSITDLISEYFEINHYDFLEDVDARNNTAYMFEVIPALNQYEELKVKEFLVNRKGTYSSPSILNSLCMKGVIPAGTYIIQVKW